MIESLCHTPDDGVISQKSCGWESIQAKLLSVISSASGIISADKKRMVNSLAGATIEFACAPGTESEHHRIAYHTMVMATDHLASSIYRANADQSQHQQGPREVKSGFHA